MVGYTRILGVSIMSMALALWACSDETADPPAAPGGAGGTGGSVGPGGSITRPNEPPVAVDDTAITFTQVPVEVTVVLNDMDPDPGDSLTVVSTTQPPNGFVEIVTGEKRVRYTSNASYIGTDTFTYIVQDTSGETDEGSVTINVTTPPVLVITSPADNETVVGPNVLISFEVTGCTVTSPSNDANGCHAHRFLDNQGDDPFGQYTSASFTTGPLADGTHTYELQLIMNDGSDQPFTPLINDTITFHVGNSGGAGGSGGSGGSGGN